MCDPERMIATPESDAEFKARVEQERRAARGAHGWLHSLGFGGGGSSNDGESSKGDGASHIGEKVGCVVLTVGVDIANSRGGFAFERDMRALYGCEVHVFDAMAGATPPDTADADADDDDDGVGGGGAEKKPRAAAGGSMTFTAGVSLASTSTAPTAVTKPRKPASAVATRRSTTTTMRTKKRTRSSAANRATTTTPPPSAARTPATPRGTPTTCALASRRRIRPSSPAATPAR